MSGSERPTYGAVQRTLALAFALLLLALATLRIDDERLAAPLLGELPSLCRAESSPCPSCGLTRGMVAALDLDFDAASRFHDAALPLVALLILQVLGRVALGSWRIAGFRAGFVGAIDFVIHLVLVGSLMNGTTPLP